MIFRTTKTKQTLQDASFEVDLKNPRHKHCAYLHIVKYSDDDKRIMYAGSCEFRQLLEAPDARKNTAWRKYVAPVDKVTIKVVAIFDHAHEAYNHSIVLAKEHRPYCNVNGQRDHAGGGVRCVDDGIAYKNAAAACKAYSIAAGTMSNHLNQRAGYTMIRGLTFERIEG